MKKLLVFIGILIVVVLLIFVSAYIFLRVKGKDIIVAKLQQSLNRPVKIGSIKVTFPLGIKINNFSIENLIDVEEIDVSLGVVSLLKKDVELSSIRLLKPKIIIIRPDTIDALVGGIYSAQNTGQDSSQPVATSSGAQTPPKNDAKSAAIGILINKFIIQNGQVKFIDKTVGPDAFNLDIINVEAVANKISFPIQPLTVQFKLSADAVTNKDSSAYAKIETDGWVDFLYKDMDGEFKISNLDATYFYPYYQKYFSKAKSALVNFRSDLKAKNNDLTAECYLQVKDLLFEESQAGQIQDIKILDIIGGSLARQARDINLDFVIKTKLTRPKIDSAQIRGMVLDKVLENVVTQPPEATMQNIQDIGDKVKSIGKDLEDQFKGIFKIDSPQD